MNTEIKNKWVSALRSGNYVQGKGQLRIDTGNVVKHCCLGVLCDVVNKHHGRSLDLNGIYPSSEICELVELDYFNPQVKFGIFGKLEYLTELNDTRELTFEQIADLIEKQL